jgi:fructose transport system permease protein
VSSDLRAATAEGDGSPSFERAASDTLLERVQHVLHRYPALSPAIVLVASCIVFTIFGDGKFQQPRNLGIVLQQTAVVGALAIGQTIVILTAGIDLSVGAAMVLAHLVMARLSAVNQWPGGIALLAGAVVATAAGALNGALVTKVKLPPFIVTLGTLNVFTAAALVYSKAQTTDGGAMGKSLLWLGHTIKIGSMNITTGVLVTLGMYVVFAYILGNTAWGRHIYATGDDAEAARLAGIDTTRVLLSAYVVAGVVFAVGAWIQLGRAGSASSNAATDANLDSITAVVIGGTSLFGGRGVLWGTLLGALIVGVFRNGLSLAGVDQNYRTLAVGILVIAAVAMDQWIRSIRK